MGRGVVRRSVVALSLLLAASTCAKNATTSSATPTNQIPFSPSTISMSPPIIDQPSRTLAPDKVTIPDLVGLSQSEATSLLESLGLHWTITTKVTDSVSPGTVLSQSRPSGIEVDVGSSVTFTVAKAGAPTTEPPPPPKTTEPPPSNCDPAYPDVCLHDGIGDYDCAGGSGNGPNYVAGPIRVLPPDPFRLDSDGDGWGCE
jgi:hypothetical protein